MPNVIERPIQECNWGASGIQAWLGKELISNCEKMGWEYNSMLGFKFRWFWDGWPDVLHLSIGLS